MFYLYLWEFPPALQFPPKNRPLVTLKLPIGVNVCVHGALQWSGVLFSVYIVLLCHVQRSWDRLWVHWDPDQDYTKKYKLIINGSHLLELSEKC